MCDEGSFNGTALDFKILEKGKFYDVRDGSTLTAGKSKFVVRIRENREDLQSEKAPKGDVYCPICFKDLNQMTETGRTQHVNNCLPSSEPSILSKAAQLTKNQSYECLKERSVMRRSLSLNQLASLKQRMESVKTKLEVRSCCRLNRRSSCRRWRRCITAGGPRTCCRTRSADAPSRHSGIRHPRST